MGVNSTVCKMSSLPEKITFGKYEISVELQQQKLLLTNHLHQRWNVKRDTSVSNAILC